MRITTDLFIVLCYIIRLVSSKETFFYENMKNLASARRAMPNSNDNVIKFEREAYPEPLPSTPESYIMSPYKTIYQGVRYKNDTRVFRKRFDYEPLVSGHQVVCQGLFDCVISHIAIESTEAIPVLLRGGAGYRHFTAIVKARPGHELRGQVRAYCRDHYQPADTTTTRKPGDLLPRRRFYFGELIGEQENWL